MKPILFILVTVATLSSCVATKKYKSLDVLYLSEKAANTKLLTELQTCLSDKTILQSEFQASLADNSRIKEELDHSKKINYNLANSIGEMAMLSRQEAENLQNSLQKIQEKDLVITSLHQAITRKDSITIALVTSLKSAIGIYDEDIQISVEKGVVFVSISDKFLFRSGSYQINERAREVLSKVAKILNDKSDLEVMVEGHTDNVPFHRGELLDNWDLSVKRSTALVRMLQTNYQISPARMIAAGRGEYIPVANNETKEGKAANRRTRIIILPKLEQFFGIIEEGLKETK